MANVLNQLGQSIGFPLVDWKPPPWPSREPMVGRFCRLDAFDLGRHASELYAAYAQDEQRAMWTYLPYGPFDTLQHYVRWLEENACGNDPQFYTILDATTAKPIGLASYLRISPPNGSIEVGHLGYSPRLQRTPAATEAMYLMMKHAFELGYRRYEWKCDALNAKSRAAAQRIGLSYEGVFRQAAVYKGRNRDTAWYAAIDREWTALERAFLRWLDPSNFDERGAQRVRLSELTAPILTLRG